MVVLAKYAKQYGGHDGLTEALSREWQARIADIPDDYRQANPLQSVYVGGGTPSLLPARYYQLLMDAIARDWPLANNVECTLEANPNAWADEPAEYRKAGFNRLSIGIQSLNDDELKALSRNHTAQEAKACVAQCREAGFNNISVDVMVGIPKQSKASWQHTLDELMALKVEHISMYGLQVEDETPLHTLIERKAVTIPEDDLHVILKRHGVKTLEQAGLFQYEFSNFAKPGRQSCHNQNYWLQGDYLALGPGAHGYIHPQRYANSRDMSAWLANPVSTGTTHLVSDAERMENAMIFGLRQIAGVSRQALKKSLGADVLDYFAPVIGKWVERGALVWEQELERLRLHPDWQATSNEVLADFISDDV